MSLSSIRSEYGHFPLNVGDKIYSFQNDVSPSDLFGDYLKKRNFFCTKDNKCMIDVFLN